VLQEKIGRFISPEIERLQEVAHKMDTQVNESFNNTVAWLAPKNKVYCGTLSLGNRIGIAVGIKSIGLVQYFTRLCKMMGINITPNMLHYLSFKDGSWFKRLNKIKTKEAKSNRIQQRIVKQKEDEVVAKKERSKRDGTYKTGQNMQPVEEEQGHQPPKKKKGITLSAMLVGSLAMQWKEPRLACTTRCEVLLLCLYKTTEILTLLRTSMPMIKWSSQMTSIPTAKTRKKTSRLQFT
jgi:hypothetical protein